LVANPDGDPLLAAEPVFHDPTPGGAEGVAVRLGHGLSKLAALFKDLTNNPAPGRSVETEAPLQIVVKLTGSQAAQAAQSAAVELSVPTSHHRRLPLGDFRFGTSSSVTP
jgi:hypothetical protein